MTFALKLLDQYSLLQYAEFLLRILVACACGAIIGFERSKRFKEAGIRTHIIVCCAAALVMIVSKYGFADLVGENIGTGTTDPARLAAQIITGVSFLGAGIIFRNGNNVKGLTTAAGIWATAGIGLAIGCGMYILGIFVTVVVAVLQIVMHRHTIGGDSMSLAWLRCTTTDPKTFRHQLDEYMEANNIQINDIKIEKAEGGSTTYELELRIARDMTINEITGFLGTMEGVQKISFEMEG